MDDDDDYRFYPTVDYSDHCLPPPLIPLPDHLFSHRPSAPPVFCDRNTPIFGADHIFSSSSSSSSSDSASTPRNSSDDGISAATRAKIAAHPLYPKLLRAFMDCHKVGAPSDTADVFDEMLGRNDHHHFNRSVAVSSSEVADPELDEFMESYCDLLFKYKSEFEKPFNEATAFLNSMETKLSNLCSGGDGVSGEATESSDEDFSAAGEPPVQEYRRRGEDRELKDMLLHKYSGYISSLKNEFSRHKKKGKLPKEARQVLLDWWTVHFRWPYPTETDKVALAESTGLDQKQINNWFINQRKRHWRPSENMHFSGMDSLYRPFFSGD